jgi:UDP-2,3-diacylglucosamine pyrophosphatase LpxH
MLIIISDIHLTDGSSGSTVHQGAFRVFRERLRALAYAASWRAGGKYKPIEECDVVLLGDVLDLLRSSAWLKPPDGATASIRPWDTSESVPFINKIRAITEAILSNNAVFFAMMREMRNTDAISVPASARDGGPLQSREVAEKIDRVRVKVRMHYMAGNHDWFYHLPHHPYSDIRRAVVETLGLDNDPSLPFPHDPEEPAAISILETFARHKVFARHGDIFDPINFEGDRHRSSLGDSIVIDLVTRFAVEAKSRLGQLLPPKCITGLNEIDNVRPLWLAPVWAGAVLRESCPDPMLHRKVQEVWNDVANHWVKMPFVRERLRPRRQFTRQLKAKLALTLSKRIMTVEGGAWMFRLATMTANARKSFYPYALEERWFRQRRARFIVYGHTHHHEIVPLNSDVAGEEQFDQLYVNSGAWRPVHELAGYSSQHRKFVGYNTMSYLAFFKDDERGGRKFEAWTGGLSPSLAVRANGEQGRSL